MLIYYYVYIVHCQVSLSDEKSTLRAVRLQQNRALEDEQRTVVEDMSRYNVNLCPIYGVQY